MRNISRLEIIIILVSGLIILAGINITFNNSKKMIPDKAQINQIDPYTPPHHYTHSDDAKSSQLSLNERAQPSRETSASIHSDCDRNCQNKIFENLAQDGLLSAENANIVLKNLDLFTQRLKQTPPLLSALLTTLQHDEEEDNGTESAAMAIFQALSVTDKVELGSVLTSSVTAEERISGLKLLASTFQTEQSAVNKLNQLLTNENDPLVLTNAISMVSILPKNIDQTGTLEALTHIIRYNQNDHFSGEALITKVSIAPSPQDVYDDVYGALKSFSDERNKTGLNAFELTIDRYSAEFEDTDGWQTDAALQDAILSIENNEKADSKTREHARRLLFNYYNR